MNIEEKVIAALWTLIRGRDFLQGKGLVRRVAEKAGIDSLEAKMTLGKLARKKIIVGVSEKGEVLGRVYLTIEAPKREEPGSLIRWREALRAIKMDEREAETLAPCHDRLDGFSDADMRDLASGLKGLKSAQETEVNTPRFVVSAKYLLGSSKMLGNLPAPSLKAFGIDIDAFPDAIPQVVVAGPENPEAVLLIENPHSFEEAIAAGCADRIALIVTYGYGLSRSGEAYGNSLTEAVAQADRLVPLIRKGNPPSPKTLLGHPKILFWGDLDREGLRIYASLRNGLPALRASALYHPMCVAMERGISHPYAKATAKEKQGTTEHVPEDATPLASICLDRGVDQETVSREEIAKLASISLGQVEQGKCQR
ncbi:Wadjet anti-phage system protein JetD domain-containing protein [Accumulibacter sp.]|uniref:Wadjet anti-phage system protein JetD domain-containing protein n=1 Tax=Accumulibacter sp. TaxID=2053492 RepID=UPI0026050084|nr:Wadjet anti-phage system protein JetD domain-containing protein [Accumulibacter sp.]